MESPFTPEQEERLLEWMAQGERPQAILRRIALENERRQGAYPWPAGITPRNLQLYRDRIRVAISEVQQERAAAALGWLGAREQLATEAAEQVNEIRMRRDEVGGLLDRLVTDGAFTFSLPDPVDSPEIIEGEVVGPPGLRPARLRPAAAELAGIDLRQARIAEELFARARFLSLQYVALTHELSGAMLLLGKALGALDLEKPLVYQALIDKREQALQRLQEQARRRGIVFDDEAEPEVRVPEPALLPGRE